MVVRVVPTNEDQLSFLKALNANLDGHVNEVDFWREPSALNHSVDIMLSPDVQQQILDELADKQFKTEILHSNVETAIQRQMQTSANESTPYATYALHSSWGPRFDGMFDSYKKLPQIHYYMDRLAREYPDKVDIGSVGKSYEGRDMKYIRITNKASGAQNKQIIWLDAGIHAREWIGPAAAMYIADKLIKNPSSDPVVQQLLNKYIFIVLPVANPDGYEFTHYTNRMWRKTRSRGPSPLCYGSDPNRNWGFQFGVAGVGKHPCDETYPGPHAFSEPETKAMADFIMRNKDNIKMYVSFHAYSQLLMTPWGHTSALPPNYKELERVGLAALKALSSKYGTQYKFGTTTNIIYAASGGSHDYAYSVAGIKYSYTFELRDTGRHGFLLPTEQIVPTCEETYDAFRTMAAMIA